MEALKRRAGRICLSDPRRLAGLPYESCVRSYRKQRDRCRLCPSPRLGDYLATQGAMALWFPGRRGQHYPPGAKQHRDQPCRRPTAARGTAHHHRIRHRLFLRRRCRRIGARGHHDQPSAGLRRRVGARHTGGSGAPGRGKRRTIGKRRLSGRLATHGTRLSDPLPAAITARTARPDQCCALSCRGALDAARFAARRPTPSRRLPRPRLALRLPASRWMPGPAALYPAGRAGAALHLRLRAGAASPGKESPARLEPAGGQPGSHRAPLAHPARHW